MDLAQIQTMVSFLRKERDETKAKLDSLDVLLGQYESMLSSMGVPAALTTETITRTLSKASPVIKEISIEDLNHFPLEASIEVQIEYLLKSSFKRFVRMPEIEKAYNIAIGGKRVIVNVARRMRTEGKLIIVKYNGSNHLAFWGLKEWIQEGAILPQHTPDSIDLPKGHNTYKISEEKETKEEEDKEGSQLDIAV